MDLLLVEDDAALRALLALEFEALGYRVTAVGDCAKALRAAARHTPDCMLLDCGLPDGAGPALLQRLRRRAPHARAVLVSGDPGRYATLPPAAGAPLLAKPVSATALHRWFAAAV